MAFLHSLMNPGILRKSQNGTLNSDTDNEQVVASGEKEEGKDNRCI